MAAVNLYKISGVLSSIDKWTIALKKNITAQDTSAAVMDVLKPADNNYVISSRTLTPSMANAHGASIYFPGRESYTKYYDKLDFAKKSKWDEFIKAYQKAYDTI